jgi:sensor histidine kinase regulating citrate/malate metabolism
VILEREFIENHYFFIKDLVEDPPAVNNIIQWLREQNEALTRLIFEQLPASFDGYKEKAVKIARDLGKADPLFDFNIDDISIAPDQKTVLDNCMVHLLRNALDHGIESPDERRKKGKSEQGTIQVSTKVDAQRLTISIRDDGRGLAIKKLRAKGEAQGLLTRTSTLQDVANVIFASGISTAHEISEISGRGVGMNAVQTFMGKVDGTIHVRLGAPKDDAGEYFDFWFEIQFKRDHHTPLAAAS